MTTDDTTTNDTTTNDTTTNDTTTNDTTTTDVPDDVITITRRGIDRILVLLGALVAIVLVVAGILLTWGSNFAEDYVDRELTAQNISFPPAENLSDEEAEQFGDLAGELVNTGAEAEEYASYIAGHIENIGGGLSYAELGGPERAANAAVDDAISSGASEAEIDELQAAADAATAQRDAVFRGELLRGTLLNTYAWWTIGRIAGIAAICAFVAAGLMSVLVGLGLVHIRRRPG